MSEGLETVYKIILPLIMSLSGAIAVLWRAMHHQMLKTEKRISVKLNDCEDRHVERDKWSVEMSEKVGKLEGLMEGHRQAREDLKELSAKVAELI
jgi:hypothetical protein